MSTNVFGDEVQDSAQPKMNVFGDVVGDVQNLNKTRLAGMPQFRQEQPSMFESLSDKVLYPAAEALTAHGMLSWPTRVANIGRQTVGLPPWQDPNTLASPIPEPGPATLPNGPTAQPPSGMPGGAGLSAGIGGTWVGLPGYSEDMGLLPQNNQGTVGEAFPKTFSAIEGIGRGLQQIGHDTVNPETLLTLPAFAEGKLAQLAKWILAGSMAKSAGDKLATLPERARELGSDPNASVGDLTKLIAEDSAQTLMPLGVGKLALGKGTPESMTIVPEAEKDLSWALQRQPSKPLPPPEVTVLPSGQGFTAGPKGVAENPMTVAEQYETQQPKPPRALLNDASEKPFQAGPTTLPQTLLNIEQVLKEGQAQAPEPTSREGVKPTKVFSGLPLDKDALKQVGLNLRDSALFAKMRDATEKPDVQESFVKGTKDAEKFQEMRDVTDGGKLYSGPSLPKLDEAVDAVKSWWKGNKETPKDWSPDIGLEQMRRELLSGKGDPINTTTAKPRLLSSGPETTLNDKIGGGVDVIKQALAKTYDAVNKGDKIYSPMDVVFDRLDGGKAQFKGPLMRMIRHPLDFDYNVELNLADKHINPIQDIVKQHDLSEKNGQRIGIYSMVQQGMKDRMVEAGVPANYIDNIVKSMTPKELEAYRVTQRQFQDLLPAVQRIAKQEYGVDVKPVENYSPIHKDWRTAKADVPEQVQPKEGALKNDAVEFLHSDFGAQGTKIAQGFTKDRLPNAKTMMDLNYFDVAQRHIRDVSHFVASQTRLNRIAEIVREPAFEKKYGDYGQKLIMDWLNAYARQGRDISAMPLLDWSRKALAKGVLGFRVASQFVHLANVPLGMQRAGLEYGVPVWYKRGLSAAKSEAGQNFLRKNIAETFERGGGERETLESQGPVAKAAFAPQRGLDRWNSQATVMGVYLRKLKESGKDWENWQNGPVDQRALAEARVETRRAVASPLYKDLPPALRSQGGKLLLQFQNTFMDQWSNLRYDLPKYMQNNPKQAMGLLVALVAMTTVESGIKLGAKQGAHQLTGYHPKSDEDDTLMKKIGHEALRRIPGMGQLLNAYDYGSSGIPLVDAAMSAVKGTKKVVEADNSKDRTLAGAELLTSGLELAGVPGTGQASELGIDALKAKYYKTHNQSVTEIAKRDGLDLTNYRQRLTAEDTYAKEQPERSEGEKVRSEESVIKSMVKRRDVVLDKLDPADKQWLKDNKVNPPGFGNVLSDSKTKVSLSDVEEKRFEEIVKEKYEHEIAWLRNSPGFSNMNEQRRKETAHLRFQDAAKDARDQVEKEIRQGRIGQ